MSAYILMHAACLLCERPFAFNPLHVPSLPIDGERQPICRACIEAVNDERRRNGLDAFPIHPAAYDGEPEENVPFGDD